MDYQHRAFDYTFQQIIAAVAKISLVRDAAVVKVCRVVSGDSAKTQSAAGAGPWLALAPSFFAPSNSFCWHLPVGLYQGLQRHCLRQRRSEQYEVLERLPQAFGHQLVPAILVHHPHLEGQELRI